MVDAVALVPGFLGFRQLSKLWRWKIERFSYFAPRFQQGLARRLGDSVVEIVPFSTLPVGSLRSRQSKLRKELAAKTSRLAKKYRDRDVRWHLVGHSTGGVDATLLLANHRLGHDSDGTTLGTEPQRWPWQRPGKPTVHIASVIALAAPHFGTGLAHQATLGNLPKLVPQLLRVVFGRPDTGSWFQRLRFATAAIKAGASPTRLLFRDELARDLRPQVVSALSAAVPAAAPLYSIATIAPPPGREFEDALFAALWELTADGDADAAPPPPLPAAIPWIPAARGSRRRCRSIARPTTASSTPSARCSARSRRSSSAITPT
jgi:pimeloyl-ACP methyl ester carboxylesterase